MATRAIVEDKQGYLWVGTKEGLYRFDGYQMTLFRHQLNNPNSLLDNHIEDLVIDHQGYLWIANRYNGVSRFDIQKEEFIHFIAGDKPSENLTANTIYEINLDQNGLWIATVEGLNYIDFQSLKVSHFLTGEEPVEIISLAVDSNDNLWLGTSNGLLFRDKKTTKISQVKNKINDDFPAMTIKEILVAEDGTIWLGTSFDGHWRYFPKTGQFVALPALPNPKKTDGNSIIQANSGHIWIGSSMQGIEIRDADSGELVKHIKHDSAIPHSLFPAGIFSLFQDSSGLIWVGNQYAGLQYFNPANAAYSVAKASPNKAQGLSASDIDAVLELSNGNLLLASSSTYAVDVIDPKQGKIDSIQLIVDFEKKQRTLNVLTMLETEKKQVWLGSFPAYLSRYDLNSKQEKHFKVPLKRQRQGAVLAMLEDKETGYLWLAMSEGLLRFDPKDNAFKTIEQKFNGSLRLIHQDAEGNIWTGNKNGLFILRKHDQKWFHFNSTTHPTFANDNVEGIFIDSQQRAWIGTQNNFYQLFSWFDEKAEFTSVNQKLAREGLGAKNIIEDQQGRIWLSLEIFFQPENWSSHKLSHIEKTDLAALKGSFQKTASGLLLFAGAKGLLKIDTQLIQAWQHIPSLVVTQIKVDQQPKAINLTTILMPAGSKSFSVNFAAIDFTEPESLSYRYMLVGYDEQWIEVNAQQRVATYTSLAPGSYNLKISAKNRANIWNSNPVVLTINVEPKYYQTWWFRAILVCMILLLIYGYIKWRVKVMAHKEHINNQMILISERADMMAELVEKKNQLLADVSHELRTPLTVLQLKVEALQHNLVKDVDASYEGLMTKISDINKLITDIYQLAQSDIGALALELTSNDSNFTLNNWAIELSETVKKSGFEWWQDIQLPINLFNVFDQNKIKQVLSNLVDNSIAYTDSPGKIAMIARVQGEQLEIYIEDSSPSVNEKDMSRIFERLFRIETSRSRATGGSGLGLSICKSIIEAHNGTIEASTSHLGGLTITIRIPIENG